MGTPENDKNVGEREPSPRKRGVWGARVRPPQDTIGANFLAPNAKAVEDDPKT